MATFCLHHRNSNTNDVAFGKIVQLEGFDNSWNLRLKSHHIMDDKTSGTTKQTFRLDNRLLQRMSPVEIVYYWPKSKCNYSIISFTSDLPILRDIQKWFSHIISWYIYYRHEH